MKKDLHPGWFRVAGIPALAFFALIAGNFWDVFIAHALPFWKAYLLQLLQIGLSWEVIRLIHFAMRKRANGTAAITRRLLLSILLYLTATIIIACSITFLTHNARLWQQQDIVLNNPQSRVQIIRHPDGGLSITPMTDSNPEQKPVKAFTNIIYIPYLFNSTLAILFCLLIAGFYEVAYSISQWKQSLSETEKLKKINLQIQVDSLKNQINPHFLFNSLNTLSSLVSRDHVRAEKFIDDMSAIYRYLLQNNGRELITLREELDFIHPFFNLLKTRYGNSIVMHIEADEKYLEHCIPPLTLQLLVENAVKHNVMSDTRPLEIRIYTDMVGQLTVENNVRRKAAAVQSNKVGLANIFAKYNLLNQPAVVISQTETLFQVILPLIDKSTQK